MVFILLVISFNLFFGLSSYFIFFWFIPLISLTLVGLADVGLVFIGSLDRLMDHLHYSILLSIQS